MAPVLYRLLLPLARQVVRLFYRRVEVQGLEDLPLQGPLLIAANHPNMLMDPLLLITLQPRSLSFLAKATLFRSRLLGGFLAACGVIPVYRRTDDPSEVGKNELTFEACFRLLERGGAVGLFPEGITHSREAVMPLKTGCARIALEAEERNAFQLGVGITPVGIYYSERPLFRSDALILFGPVLDPADHFDLYRREPSRAVRELTSALERRLRDLTLHVPREEDEPLVAFLRQIFEAPSSPMSARLEVDRALVEAIEYFRGMEPERYRTLRRDIMRYARLLAVLGLTHSQIQRRYPMGPVLRTLAPRLLLAVLGFPLYALSAIHHVLPYKLPAYIARAATREVVEIATIKLVAGMITFPVFYAVQTWLVARWLGGIPALFYLLLLPPSALFALAYQEAVGGVLEEARVFFVHLLRRDRLSRLESRQQSLLTSLEICRREYLDRTSLSS